MARQLKKFCYITQYIDKIDGEFSKMISDFCFGRLFVPRNPNGITFLYPADEKYRNKILDAAYSENTEKALQMLQSLIIPDFLPTTRDFISRKDDLPNLLGQKILVDGAANGAAAVKLTCGATIRPDPGFKTQETSRTNMCFYILEGGEIPLNGPVSKMKYLRGPPRPALGGGDNASPGKEFYAKIKAEHLADLQAGNTHNVRLITIITAFLRWLAKNHREHLATLVHSGRLAPCPLMCFFAGLNPLGDEPQSAEFIGLGERAFIHLSKSDDALEEFQSILKECHKAAGNSGRTEESRRALQTECTKIPVPMKSISAAVKAYGTYYGENWFQMLKWHELNFLVLRSIMDSNGEVVGKQKAKYMSNAYSTYEQNYNSNKAQILDESKQSRPDPHHILSCAVMFIGSTLFLGGPEDPSQWSDADLGSAEPGAIEAECEDGNGMVNVHAILTGSLFKTGVPALLSKSVVSGLMSE